MIVGHIGGGSESGIDTGDIEHSLRFAASRSTYMSRTPPAGNRKIWTWSGWVKRSKLGAIQQLLSVSSGGSNDQGTFSILFDASDRLAINAYTFNFLITTRVFRDPSSATHICVRFDTTDTIANNRIRVFINGVEETSFTTRNNPALNTDYGINITYTHYLGRNSVSATNYLDGYLSRICFVDGQALTPDSFGYFNTEINEWVTKSQSEVKAVVDAGGTNSFMLDFDDGTSLTTLGYDKSSKGNHWTLSGHSLTAGPNYDWMEDVPGNSFATLNPLHTGRSTLTSGNLTASGTTDLPTILPSSGTWYFERGGVAQTWTPPTSFPSGSGSYNFGQQPWQGAGPAGGQKALCQRELDAAGTVTVSGTFTGNAVGDGPFVWMNGSPNTLTINGNAVTFGTHADRLANGFKVRTNSASYNAAGSNTWTATISSNLQNLFKYNNAKDNS